jgi:hypothetical protein
LLPRAVQRHDVRYVYGIPDRGNVAAVASRSESEGGDVSFTGILLAEGLRKDAPLDTPSLRLRRIWRTDAGDPSAGQPLTWTFIEFENPDDNIEVFAEALAGAIEPEAWYCDFHSEDETFVVFADRVFRYPRGDKSGRASAEDYARSVGVPEAQIDWRV